MKRKYYLAYGSNLNMRQMAWRCPSATPVGTGVIEGWRLEFHGSWSGAYLTIVPCEGSSVPVGVWSITESDEAALDRYEGFPTFYFKQPMRIACQFTQSGKFMTVKAMVYIMHVDRPEGAPTASYVRTCANGYHDFGLDLSFLQGALDRVNWEGVKNYEE